METEGPGAYDPESVKARYLAERDRRLVPGRTDIVDVRADERFARYTRDPFTPYTDRDGIDEELDVVIVGGGIAVGAGERLFAPLQSMLDGFEWRPGGQQARLLPAALGDSAGCLGAVFHLINDATDTSSARR